MHAVRLAVLMLAALPVAALAAPVQVRLTPAQIEAAMAAGETRNLAAEALALGGEPRDRQLHGEFGAGIGTGGYKSVYGTVVAPLGESGTAAFSFAQTDYGRRRGYYTSGGFGYSR